MRPEIISVGDKAKKDANWMILAEDAKREIKRLQKQVYKLRKSFIFFNEKYESGVEFPAAIKAIDGKRLQYRESVDNPPYLPNPTGQMEAKFEEEPF